MAIAKLDVATRRAALDKKITTAEARTLIKEAKASGSKKPIDDIFKAIDRTSAAIETGATRLILKELDQTMTKAEWVAYAQKATSPAGVWGPGSDGGKNVKRADVPAAIQKIHDKWLKSSPEDDVNMTAIEVAGKPVYLLSQYSEFGTSFAAFDAAGKNIELKEDTKNVDRNKKRIQGAYAEHFGTPDMKAWKGTIENTDLGVIRNYYANASELKGKTRTDALTAEMKAVLSEDKKKLKGDSVEGQVFRNKSDGSLLLITGDRTGRGAEHFALFDKRGELVKRFSIDT